MLFLLKPSLKKRSIKVRQMYKRQFSHNEKVKGKMSENLFVEKIKCCTAMQIVVKGVDKKNDFFIFLRYWSEFVLNY